MRSFRSSIRRRRARTSSRRRPGSRPVPKPTARLAQVGFCYGGGMVNFRLPRSRTSRSGSRSTAAPRTPRTSKIKAAMLIQSAEVDERINAAWPAYETALKAANVRYERHLYPGTQHGFNNDTTPRYDANAAKLAWERTLAQFKKYLS